MNNDIIKEIVTDENTGRFLSTRMTEKFFTKYHPELIPYIQESTKFYSDEEVPFNKRIMLVLADKTSRLTCGWCSIEVSPMSRGESAGLFRQYCSSVCSGKARIGMKHVRTEEHQASINAKRAETMQSLYGYAYNSQRPDVKELLVAAKHTTHDHIRYDILMDRDYLIDLYKTLPSTDIGEICNCDYSVVLDYLRKYDVEIGSDHTKVSRDQRAIADFIVSLGFDVEINSKVLAKQDIDIYVPSRKVGVEFNGFPWHLEGFTQGKRGKDYHIGKTISATAAGIRLIHMYPTDNKEVMFSIIRNALGVSSKRVHGRKCDVVWIDKTIARDFLDANHLRGNSNFDVAIGLYHEGALVHVMTFGKSRFDTGFTYEVIRSASLINTSVMGGVSKCVKFFDWNFCKSGDTIMTYADRSISEGKSYLHAGFSYVRATPAGYRYVEQKAGKFIIHSRQKFQKHKLTGFELYDASKTEWEIMRASGYDRFWDSGNNVYEYHAK